MPSPLADFESNFRTAETLLKVYRLLDTPDGPQTEHTLMRQVRDLLMARDDEEIVLLVNELFLGAVREHADVNKKVFKHDSLCLLLRQAMVAACSSVDVYYPTLLREHLPRIIQVKQRNFLPTDRMTKDFLKDFTLSLEDSLRMLADPDPVKVLGEFFFEHLRRKTLSTSQGVAVVLQILGVDEPWSKIAAKLGTTKEPLMRQFDGLVNRRNDIVHRGDRSAKDPNGPPQEINLPWTDSHVRIARSVVLASDELVAEQIRAFPAPDTASAAVVPTINDEKLSVE